jgi:hypothetical protein
MVDVEKRIKSAASQAVSYRNYRRARERALTRLAQAYPDEYKQYLQEEKARDEETKKKWLDITGNTSTAVVVDTPAYNQDRTYTQGADQGDNGGKA